MNIGMVLKLLCCQSAGILSATPVFYRCKRENDAGGCPDLANDYVNLNLKHQLGKTAEELRPLKYCVTCLLNRDQGITGRETYQ